MKKNIIVFIIIFFITIGFAAVNTVLDMKGNISLSFNANDFKVYIGFVGINNQNNSESLSSDKQKFFISTKENDIINYTVVNDSFQYDTYVNLVCDSEEGIIINQVGNIPAQTTLSSKVSVIDGQDVSCHIEIDKIERTSIAEENILKRWFAFENIQDKDQDEVFSNPNYFEYLMSNQEALKFLLENQELVNIIKSDRNYLDILVPIILKHASTSKELNSLFYQSKLPCYIYNRGTYYLINSMTYVGPTYSSAQSHSHSNSANGLYFYIVGTSSASQSLGIHYSDQNINPNGYSNMGIISNFSTNLPQYDTTSIGLYNGSAVSGKWEAYFTGVLVSGEINQGESTKLLKLPNVNSNYRVVINQLVNKYQVSGNYYNQTYLRSLWLQ